MDSAAAATRLKSAFQEVLGIPASTDFESLVYQGIPEWDSVAHLQLISAIEREFAVMIDTDDVLDMSSFKKAKSILAKHDIKID